MAERKADRKLNTAAASTRIAERVSTKVPVLLDDGSVGITRDVSPHGIYFTVKDELTEGQRLRFTLEFDHSSGILQLTCESRVVRVEEVDGKLGVAAVILTSHLERVPSR
jgi:hypothetical protein